MTRSLTLDPNVARSEPECLFLGTVAEIDEKVLKDGRYNLIRAAGLLRQLFLDPVPLLHSYKNLDAFLKSPCFRVGTETASVHDLIRACANVKGGVHLGKTRTSEEDTVLDWDKIFVCLVKNPVFWR